MPRLLQVAPKPIGRFGATPSAGNKESIIVGRENYSYKKFQRELASKKKAEEKKQKRLEKKAMEAMSNSGQASNDQVIIE